MNRNFDFTSIGFSLHPTSVFGGIRLWEKISEEEVVHILFRKNCQWVYVGSKIAGKWRFIFAGKVLNVQEVVEKMRGRRLGCWLKVLRRFQLAEFISLYK